MKINEFLKLTREAKSGYSGVNHKQINNFVSNGRKTQRLVVKEELKGSLGTHVVTKALTLNFKNPHQLTIFEATMIFNLLVLKKKSIGEFSPSGYAECEAGREFIENIESYEVLI